MTSGNKIFRLLLLLGLLLRVVHGIATWEQNPLNRHLTADALYYDQWSEEIARGNLAAERPFYLPPLYPFLLALLRLLFSDILPAVLVLQGLLGLCSLYLVYRITASHFNARAGLFAMGLSLLYSPLIFYENKVLATTLAVTLGLLSIFLLQKALSRPRFRSLALAGLSIGLLCEARPNFLIFALLVLILPLVRLKGGFAERLKAAAFMVLGLALPLSGSLAYNLALTGDAILVSGNGGINLYFGNHAGASGVNDAPTREFSSIFDQKASAKRLAEAETGRSMTQGEVSSFWRRKAVDRIRSDVHATAALLMKKARLFFSSFEYGVIYVPEVERHLSYVLSVQMLPAGLILFLGLGGIGLALRRKTKGLWPLLLFLLSNLATVLLFFMASRFRLPFVAGILPFAGYLLSEGVEATARKKYIVPATLTVVIAFLTILSFLCVDGKIRGEQSARAGLSLSSAFLKEGRLEEAREEAQKSLAIGISPAVFYHLGMIEEAAGHWEEAVANYREASRIDPSFLDPLDSLAALYERSREWDQAVALRERMIEIVPYRYEGYYNLGLTLIEAGRLEEGAARLDEAGDLGIPSADAWEVMGSAYDAAGKPQKALQAYQKARALDPGRAARLKDKMARLETEP